MGFHEHDCLLEHDEGEDITEEDRKETWMRHLRGERDEEEIYPFGRPTQQVLQVTNPGQYQTGNSLGAGNPFAEKARQDAAMRENSVQDCKRKIDTYHFNLMCAFHQGLKGRDAVTTDLITYVGTLVDFFNDHISRNQMTIRPFTHEELLIDRAEILGVYMRLKQPRQQQ